MAPISESTPRTQPIRQLLLPREHGAWAILAIPLLTGAVVGMLQAGVDSATVLSLFWFTVAALSLFCLRNPIEALLGEGPASTRGPVDRRAAILVAAPLTLLVLVGGGALLWRGHNLALLGLGALSGILFQVQRAMAAAAKRARARRRPEGVNARMAAQIIAVVCLSSTAAGAYYVITGAFDRHAWVLWLANCIFAGNQVHYVQLRITGSKLKNRYEKFACGRTFLAGQLLMMALLVLAWRYGYLSGAALVAFVPILVRGIAWFLHRWEPLRVRRLGLTELAHGVVFGVLLTASFLIAR